MATTPDNNPSDLLRLRSFNDWLIEEMYDRYLSDPSSVDAAWVEFFRKQTADAPGAAPTSAPAPASTARPAPAPAAAAPASAPVAAASVAAPAAPPAATQAAPAASVRDSEKQKEVARQVETIKAAAPAKSGPQDPGSGGGLSANRPTGPVQAQAKDGATTTILKGAPMRTAKNMDLSLSMPTATTVRNVPMKLVIDQRQLINDHLARTTGGKISFTHLIGYAMVKALTMVPEMNCAYAEVEGKPAVVVPASINLGLAIDQKKGDVRQLLVPNIKGADEMNFAEFWRAYEDLVKKARTGALTVDDFAGTTVSLTNPGGLGTSHSVPRLMTGQGIILGVGSIDWPPEFQGASDQRRNELGVSKITTLTSTYDHRVIQGATSGEFLKVMHELMIGKHDFYDQIFAALRIPYTPLRWEDDDSAHRSYEVNKGARVIQLIEAFRTWGHLVADTDPLE